jgi:Protein of unknown function (DUF1579)
MNRRNTLLSVIACIAVFALALAAQDKKPADHGPNAKGKAKAEQTEPQGAPGGMMTKQAAEMHKAIQAMQGTWATKGVLEKSEMMPNGGTDTGTSVFKPGPGGLSLTQDYHSKGSLGEFHGYSLIWFDPKDSMFHSMWCDSMTPSGCAEAGTGKWEGDKIVLNTKMDMGGKSMDMRGTLGPFEGNTFKYVEEVGDNGQYKPNMTITYTKKSGPPAATKANPKM